MLHMFWCLSFFRHTLRPGDMLQFTMFCTVTLRTEVFHLFIIQALWGSCWVHSPFWKSQQKKSCFVVAPLFFGGAFCVPQAHPLSGTSRHIMSYKPNELDHSASPSSILLIMAKYMDRALSQLLDWSWRYAILESTLSLPWISFGSLDLMMVLHLPPTNWQKFNSLNMRGFVT